MINSFEQKKVALNVYYLMTTILYCLCVIGVVAYMVIAGVLIKGTGELLSVIGYGFGTFVGCTAGWLSLRLAGISVETAVETLELKKDEKKK